MTVNLTCEPVEVGQLILVTAQLKIEVTDPEVMDNHALVSDLYISLSMQPYEEDEEDE